MTRYLLLLAALGVVAPFLSSGCGGAAPSAATPARGLSGADVSTPEAAAAVVEQAERTIDQLLGPTQSTVISQQAGAGQFAQAPAPPPAQPSAESQPHAGKADVAKKAEAPASAPLSDPCTTACSALASMERATDHLCNLAGASDTRCASARARVKVAHDRVHASCPACAG
jgi:hypothetical protein